MVTPWKQVYSWDKLGAAFSTEAGEVRSFQGSLESAGDALLTSPGCESLLWIQGWTWPRQGNGRAKHAGQVRLQQGHQSQQCPALCWVRGEFWNSICPHPLVWIPWVMLTRCSIAFLLMKPLGPGVLTALTFKLGVLNKYLTAEIHLQSCALKAST